MVNDVFKDDQRRLQSEDGVGNSGPEVAVIVGAFPESRRAEWLAGITGCDYVNGLHAGEVQLGYVAVVRYAGEVMVKDARRGLVIFHMPGDLAA